MSNILKMDLVKAIQALKSKGWSKRRIARELQIDRQTVRKYLRAASNSPPLSIPDTAQADSGQNHPLSTPGSERPSDQNHPLSTLGNLEVTAVIERVYAESSGRPGKCQTYAERIEAKVHLGLTAQRIYLSGLGHRSRVQGFLPGRQTIRSPAQGEFAHADLPRRGSTR